MAEGFVQIAADGPGKQLDNDVVTIPAGTIVTDNFGNQTVLSSPAFYYRERVVNADPNDPRGLGNVRNDFGLSVADYGSVVRLAPGNQEMQQIVPLLQDIDLQLSLLTGNPPLGPVGPQGAQAIRLYNPPSPLISPSVPQPLIADRYGKQIIIPVGGRGMTTAQSTTITVNTETNIFPADLGNFNDLLAITVANTSATAVRVDIRDQPSTVTAPASSNGVIAIYVPAGDMRGISFQVPDYQSNPNQPWTATVSSAVTDIRVWAYFAQHRVA